MARNDLPSSDNDLNVWLQNFVTNLTINAATVGLAPADLTPITDASGAFTTSLTSSQTQKGLADAATALKNTDRSAAVDIVRPLIQRIVKHPGMTDQLRGLLGLGRDDQIESPIPINELIPAVFLESTVAQVTVHWGPNPTNERINGKPLGVQGARIYRKKSGEDDFQIVGYARTSPYYDGIVGPGADYTYYVRYQGTKATDLSPQSEEATVAARGALAA